MKKKSLVIGLIALLALTMVFAGCTPKRNIKNMEKYFIENGYEEDYFVRFDNFIFKAILKQFGLEGGLGYFSPDESFMVIKLLEGTTEDQVMDDIGELLVQMNALGTTEMGELGEVSEDVVSDPGSVREYVDANEPFLLIHANTNPLLVNLFRGY